MRRALISSAAFALLLLVGSPAKAQVSFGIEIGRPPAPRAYRVEPRPGPDYEWVEGYWYANGRRWVWHDGYWTRPPYAGAYWVQPYYDSGRFVGGYWEGGGRRFDHDHRWDRERRRDWREERREDRR